MATPAGPGGAAATLREVFAREMRLRGYSPRTVRVYEAHVRGFVRHVRRHPREVEDPQIRAYLEDRSSAASTRELPLSRRPTQQSVGILGGVIY
jgi:hypothetical protein